MAEIIDVLTTPIDKGAQFTVNTAVATVDLVTVTGFQERMYAGSGTSLFARGDNFILLSCGFFIPESFVMSEYENLGPGDYPVPVLLFAGEKQGGGIISFFNIGSNGLLRIPFANYEMSNGVFINPEDNNLTDNFYFTCLFPYTVGVDRPQISMQNVPAALNGDTFYVTPFVKILHNTALT